MANLAAGGAGGKRRGGVVFSAADVREMGYKSLLSPP